MVIDELLSVPIAKVLGWILTGAAKVKRWISLLRRAIELIDLDVVGRSTRWTRDVHSAARDLDRWVSA